MLIKSKIARKKEGRANKNRRRALFIGAFDFVLFDANIIEDYIKRIKTKRALTRVIKSKMRAPPGALRFFLKKQR